MRKRGMGEGMSDKESIWIRCIVGSRETIVEIWFCVCRNSRDNHENVFK